MSRVIRHLLKVYRRNMAAGKMRGPCGNFSGRWEFSGDWWPARGFANSFPVDRPRSSHFISVSAGVFVARAGVFHVRNAESHIRSTTPPKASVNPSLR